MPRERSLLERFRSPEIDSERTIHVDTKRLADSVLDNLRRLLNSHQGNVPIRSDYGIPPIVDVLHNFPDAIGGMRKAIKTAIEVYEPRLRRVSVRHVENPDDPLALNFEISAELVTEEDKASVQISTRIDGSGHVRVKG
ncbi:MAG TPA: type VI secretion system baseplate subunit TssE [Candidatus Sulfotelmatobacter sp.]|nr:type VI secretion system baseplate subunit TssE [Candidatus Sulfotelmatobacter sp.]